MRDKGGGAGGGDMGQQANHFNNYNNTFKNIRSQKLKASYRVTHMCAISLIILLRQLSRVRQRIGVTDYLLSSLLC